MGIMEGTCDGHRVMNGNVESPFCIPETNVALYVNYTGNKINKNLKMKTLKYSKEILQKIFKDDQPLTEDH